MTKPELVFRPMEPTDADLELFQECFGRNGSPKVMDGLQWQYLQNPVGDIFVDFAVDEDQETPKLAAIYASLPSKFKVGAEVVTAVQSLDTLTDVDYRGQGLFVRAAESVFTRCTSEKVSFIYGFPNGNSAHGFFNRLGWLPLDPMPFLFKPLRSSYFVRRLRVPGLIVDRLPDVSLTRRREPELDDTYKIRHGLHFDERFDGLWERFSRDIKVAINRSQEYLRWRFETKPRLPGEEYQMLALHKGESLVAFVVYCSKSNHGGKIGYIMEYICDPGHLDAGQALLRKAVNALADRDCDVALAWNFKHSPNQHAYKGCGFLDFPERIRPIELHMGVRPLAIADDSLIGDRRNWYISYCDSDTV